MTDQPEMSRLTAVAWATGFVCLTLSTLAANVAAQPQPPGTVAAAFKDPGQEWEEYPTRTLENLPAAVREKVDSGTDFLWRLEHFLFR